MDTPQHLYFPPFHLDLSAEQLWHETQAIPLRQKTFAVLRYLLEHPNQLVTKEALLDAVWAETTVSDIAPGVCVQELRRALGDDRQTPRFIVTVHRRGYRFIGEVQSPRSKVQGPKFDPAPSPQHPAPVLVGREAELTQLHSWLDKTLNGERQIVFVTGEPGIGKTSLLEAFVAEASRRVGMAHPTAAHSLSPPYPQSQIPTPAPWLGRGQCIEQYGPGEPYMPILEALSRLCREPEGERLTAVLRQHAPTWLVQMPTLLPAAELEVLRRQTQGMTRERMLREMGEAIDAITAECPLVLWLEDLHWSDASTLELLALLARRQEPARLLIISTYRPVEMLTEQHPLKPLTNELYAHQRAHELPVTRLNEAAVENYLAQRFPQSIFPTRLAQVLYRRSGGNPLFLKTLVQELVQSKVLVQADDGLWAMLGDVAELETWTPESVQQVLTRQRDRLGNEEHRVLAAASLAGVEFSAAAVAAALETETIHVEEHCSRLVEQQQFLRLAGISDWPDGTHAARYGFLHALYQAFWHERVSVGHLQQWHLRIGECVEHAYGARAKEIAAELAVHFEQGRAYEKAVRYLRLAGENATQCSAYVEAISHLTKGRELLKILPNTAERDQQELRLLKPLSPALISMKGYGNPEVKHIYARAYEICQQSGDPHQLLAVLPGLWVLYLMRGEVRTALDLAEQAFQLAQRVSMSTAFMGVHAMLGESLLYLGRMNAAREHLAQAWELYIPREHNLHVMQTWIDPGVALLSLMAQTLSLLGYPDQAQQKLDEGVALAENLSHPFSLAYVSTFACYLHFVRQEWQLTRERAEVVISLSTEQGFPYWLAQGTVMRGRALVAQGQVEDGLAQMQQGLAFFRTTGTEMMRLNHLPGLAVAYASIGREEEGLAMLAEVLAFVDKTGVRLNEAEMYRIKGELTLQQFQVSGSKFQVEKGPRPKACPEPSRRGRSPKSKNTDPRPLTPDPQGEAEACFLKAIEVSRSQQAKSLELCATMSLARLWQQQSKKNEAHRVLSEVYNWFAEGFGTKGLQEAKALLTELSRGEIEDVAGKFRILRNEKYEGRKKN